MAAWSAFLRGESVHPVPFEAARRSMLLTFAAVEALQSGHSVDIEGVMGTSLPGLLFIVNSLELGTAPRSRSSLY